MRKFRLNIGSVKSATFFYYQDYALISCDPVFCFLSALFGSLIWGFSYITVPEAVVSALFATEINELS